MTTYIVSGYMRSGTSMMMRALIAGMGVEPLFDPNRDQMLNGKHASDGYVPNPAYYEPSARQFAELGFPRAYEGRLIKVLTGGIPSLAPLDGGSRVVLMRRDPEEIRQSIEGFFGDRAPVWLPDGYAARIALTLDHLSNRRDVLSVTVLDYADVVADPVEAFGTLSRDGWPVDVQAASEIVDPALYRYRLDALEVGI